MNIIIFLKATPPNFNTAYYSFPNISTPINIHKNVNVHIKDNFIRVSESKQFGYTITVNQIRQAPLLVEWSGKLDKVTIVFKPLGLNNFIQKPFNDVVDRNFSVFSLPGVIVLDSEIF